MTCYDLWIKLRGRGNPARGARWWPDGEPFGPSNPNYPKTLAEAVATHLADPQAIYVEVRHPEGWVEWWYPDGRRERPHPPSKPSMRKQHSPLRAKPKPPRGMR